MVLRAIWRSKGFCIDILRMPGEHLGLAFPAFGVDSRRDGGKRLIVPFAADHEIFSHCFCSACTRCLWMPS
jgi:hypothetical protein